MAIFTLSEETSGPGERRLEAEPPSPFRHPATFSTRGPFCLSSPSQKDLVLEKGIWKRSHHLRSDILPLSPSVDPFSYLHLLRMTWPCRKSSEGGSPISIQISCHSLPPWALTVSINRGASPEERHLTTEAPTLFRYPATFSICELPWLSSHCSSNSPGPRHQNLNSTKPNQQKDAFPLGHSSGSWHPGDLTIRQSNRPPILPAHNRRSSKTPKTVSRQACLLLSPFLGQERHRTGQFPQHQSPNRAQRANYACIV